MSSTVSDADSRAADYETVERRYNIAVNLESWELLAMHSIASDEVCCVLNNPFTFFFSLSLSLSLSLFFFFVVLRYTVRSYNKKKNYNNNAHKR